MYKKLERNRTEVASFRLPIDLLVQLRQEARTNKVNLNNLVTQILFSHVDLYSPAFAAGMLPFPKKIVNAMINTLNEKEIEELSKQMASNNLVNLAYMTNNCNEQLFINTLLAWMRHSGFSIQDLVDGETRTIVIKHDMGDKWSLFMTKSIKQCFDYFRISEVEFESSNEIVVIKLRQLYG